MSKTRILTVLSVGLVLLANIPFSESVLWDLLVTVNIENDPLLEKENPIVSGYVIDHAGKSVSGAEIQIRSGVDTVIIISDENGEFHHEFTNLDFLPGEHVVNVMATSEENKIGLASKNFQVKGALSASSYTAKLLETPEAIKFLNSNPDEFKHDPIGLTLYNHYQELQTQYLQEESIQKNVDDQKLELDKTRSISGNLTQKIIEEKNPGAGIFSGWKYDVFVSNLDLEIRDLIVKQMNYTVNTFDEAQNAMNEVLENGGTYQEAREAYFEKATISRDMMEQITYEIQTNETSVLENINSTENFNDIEFLNSTNSEEMFEETLVNINGTEIQVGMSGSTIFLNVNGTMIEFLINGTQITQITNSTQN